MQKSFNTIIGAIVFGEKNIELVQQSDAPPAKTTEEKKNALRFLKNKEFFPKFREANIRLTKKKIRESTKKDLLIIQTINCIDEMTKAINTLTKRLREWYEYYNPEFSRAVYDNEKFVEEITTKTREELLAEIKLEEKETMGADIEKIDISQILQLAKQVQYLQASKKDHELYLNLLMKEVCPNVREIAGISIGAKLMAIAGSLERLAVLPASTIQLLGAEKALFRHLKTKSLPPKYGVIHEHPLIARAKLKEHGKIARTLADKISIGAKIDYFKGEFIGDKLKQGIESKFGKY
ncbi:MAG TPA: hypothetical protein VI894_03335 [Candidatus Nanoarchaeia archaeon]|nr:hypothetical protein [Candidatus Nanoarchaeia archaeon]